MPLRLAGHEGCEAGDGHRGVEYFRARGGEGNWGSFVVVGGRNVGIGVVIPVVCRFLDEIIEIRLQVDQTGWTPLAAMRWVERTDCFFIDYL